MTIKYHEWGNGNDYGADHKLTNNWNPDADYGNEYVKVYFNIDTPTYDYQTGFTSTENHDAWYNEAFKLIESFGIMEDCGYKVEHSKEKCAYLYAHPQQISGAILKNDVKKIAEAISKMKLSSIRWVDLHETVYILSDDEYNDYLDGRKAEIRTALFTESATTRTNKYYRAFDVARSLAGKFRLKRLGLNDGVNYGGGQTIDYILNVAEELISEGFLKSFEQNGEKYIRSLNKTEQKKLKVTFA